MKKCPFCAEEIQDEAIFCKHCKRDLVPINTKPNVKPKKSKRKLIWGYLVFFILLIVVGMFVNSGTDQKSRNSAGGRFTKQTVSELERNFAELKSTGLLKKTELGNYYYVDPAIWSRLNIDAKKGICMVLADYANTKGDRAWCEVKDYNSGKKLAKLNSWGFETY